MISAKEAVRKTIVSSTAKTEMTKIETFIKNAIERGQYSTRVSTTGYADDVLAAITGELESLGYVVKYDPPKPLPMGCRSDQWDFYGYLEVSWKQAN